MPHKSAGRLVCAIALLLMGLSINSVSFAQQPAARTQTTEASATARNAGSVRLAASATGGAELRMVDAVNWVEIDAAGQVINRYEEVRRDTSSVHLSDSSRGVTLQLDLNTRKAIYNDSVRRRRDQVNILSATATAIQAEVAAQQARAGERQAGPLSTRERRPGDVAPAAPQGPAFCMNDAVLRGPGTLPGRVADCPAGYTNQGASCKREADTIKAPSIAPDCPAGYSLDGASCERAAQTKPNPTGRPADCPKNFTNEGTICFSLSAPQPLPASSMTCKAGETKVEARCFKPCEAGFTGNGANCTRPASTLTADKATCKAGYQKDAKTNRCMAPCAAGYTNNGESCVRTADTLGTESMSCKAGETRAGGRCVATANACAKGEVLQGGLCYSACAPGLEGVGAACWPQAPKSWLACGIGSARDAQACAAATFDQVMLVKQLAVSLGRMASAPAVGSAAQARTANMQKKYRELTEATNRAKDTAQFKADFDAWKQANQGKDAQANLASLDSMASATGEDAMLRYAAQLAGIAGASGAAEPSYPKCSTVK